MNRVLGLLFVECDEHLGFMNAGNLHGQFVAVECAKGTGTAGCGVRITDGVVIVKHLSGSSNSLTFWSRGFTFKF